MTNAARTGRDGPGEGAEVGAQALERGDLAFVDPAAEQARGGVGGGPVVGGVHAQPVDLVVDDHEGVAAAAQRLPQQVAQREEAALLRHEEAVVQVAPQDVLRMHRERGVELADERGKPRQPRVV